MNFATMKQKWVLLACMGLLVTGFGFTSVASADDQVKTSGPARIDIIGKVALEPINGEGDVKLQHAGWIKDEAEKAKFLLSVSMDAKGDQWTQYQVSFKALEDGAVALTFRGQWDKVKRNWIYVDGVTAEGITIVNGDFEETTPNGLPTGWYLPLSIAQYIVDPALSQSGRACVHVWHDRPAVQNIHVKANQDITVKFWVKFEKQDDRE